MQTLREVRRAKKLTLDALGAEVGVTASQLSRIEREGNASVETALAIEAWSGRTVAAETLSPDVALARRNMRAA